MEYTKKSEGKQPIEQKTTAEHELQRYYSLWKDCNAMYEEWAKEQGLSSNGMLVLYSFYSGEEICTQKTICQKWGIPKQTVNTILKDLEQKGYVQMLSLPEDKRNKQIRLTPAGKAYADTVIGKLQEKEMYVVERMGLAQLSRMNDGLEQFIGFFRKGV